MEFLEQLKAMPVGDLVAHIAVVLGIISVIIEKSKKLPFNPWSKLFNWIGSKTTEPISKRLDEFEAEQNKKMEDLQEQDKKTRELIREIREDYKESIKTIREDYNSRIDKLEYDSDEKEVKRLRSNIICFADACRQGGARHTKQHFENIFRDYDDYLKYCNARNFQNHYIDGEMAFVNSIFAEYSKDNKFL